MLDSKLLKEIEEELVKMINILYKTNTRANYKNMINQNEFNRLCTLGLKLTEYFRPSFHISIPEKIKADEYISKHPEQKKNQRDKHYNDCLNIQSKYNYQISFNHLGQINLIKEPISDTLKLATLIEFFSQLAHIQNSKITNQCYEVKNKLITHLLKSAPNNAFVIPSNGKQNANVSIILSINDTYLAWHSKSTSMLTQKLPDAFYTLAQKALSTKREFANKKLPPSELKELFIKANFDDSFIKTLLELNNPIRISFLAEQEKENKHKKTHKQNVTIPSKTEQSTFLSIDEDVQEATVDIQQEFIGGGVYDESTEKETPSTSSKTKLRDDNKIWEEITSSDNSSIQKLLKLSNTQKSCYGFKISEIIKMEIFQKAFDAGIISKEELINYQLSNLDAIISSTPNNKRIEIKSCGKEDWNTGKKFLLLRVQPLLAAKPILWEIPNELVELLLSEHSEKIQKTTGYTVKSIDNLPLIEKLTAEKENITPKPKKVVSPPPPTFTAKNLDDFLNQPDSKERLHEAMQNATPEMKALLATIVFQLVPGSIPPPSIPKPRRNTKRNGGPAHE